MLYFVIQWAGHLLGIEPREGQSSKRFPQEIILGVSG